MFIVMIIGFILFLNFTLFQIKAGKSIFLVYQVELQSNLRHLLLFLSQKGYSFKIPANLHQSQRLAFGGAGYLSTGKQVTIYLPMTLNEAELENFCIKLNEVLSIKKFPKVITDIQYKNTPLF